MQLVVMPRAMVLTLLAAACGATERPIIGILLQEPSAEILEHYPSATEFMSASYVKAVEAAGARVVPIHINRTAQYYKDVVSWVNGAVFPGGDASLEAPDGYAAAGRQVVAASEQLHKDGVPFPVLGVCLGMELLMYLASGSTKESQILVDCSARNSRMPLDFEEAAARSRLYRLADERVLEILRALPVTANHHVHCVTEESLGAHHLEQNWTVLTTNHDTRGLKFISSIERKDRPVAGVQFHPEKNMYEWNPQQVNPHSRKAILANRVFYDWLVHESRVNNQSFPDEASERDALVYNFSPLYTGAYGGYNEQVYVFHSPRLPLDLPEVLAVD